MGYTVGDSVWLRFPRNPDAVFSGIVEDVIGLRAFVKVRLTGRTVELPINQLSLM